MRVQIDHDPRGMGRMSIFAIGVDEEKAPAIQDAIRRHFAHVPDEDWWLTTSRAMNWPGISAGAVIVVASFDAYQLHEPDDEQMEALAREIRDANGGPCRLDVDINAVPWFDFQHVELEEQEPREQDS